MSDQTRASVDGRIRVLMVIDDIAGRASEDLFPGSMFDGTDNSFKHVPHDKLAVQCFKAYQALSRIYTYAHIGIGTCVEHAAWVESFLKDEADSVRHNLIPHPQQYKKTPPELDFPVSKLPTIDSPDMPQENTATPCDIPNTPQQHEVVPLRNITAIAKSLNMDESEAHAIILYNHEMTLTEDEEMVDMDINCDDRAWAYINMVSHGLKVSPGAVLVGTLCRHIEERQLSGLDKP